MTRRGNLLGVPCLALRDNDNAGVLGRYSPGACPALPGIVEEDVVLFVVRDKDTALLSGNQKLLVVGCRLQPEIPGGFRVMAGIPEEIRYLNGHVAVGVKNSQRERQAAFAARRPSMIALFWL